MEEGEIHDQMANLLFQCFPTMSSRQDLYDSARSSSFILIVIKFGVE